MNEVASVAGKSMGKGGKLLGLLELILPTALSIADKAMDERRAKREYQQACGLIEKSEADTSEKKEALKVLNDNYAKRSVSEKAYTAIANLNIDSILPDELPADHLRYLIEANKKLISSDKLSTYIDVQISEIMSNVAKGGDYEITHLYVIYYAVTGEVYTATQKVDELKRHLALNALANVIVSPSRETIETAIELLRRVDVCSAIEMFRFGISMNVITKDTNKNVDYKKDLFDYLKTQGVEDNDREKILNELLSMIPDTVKSGSSDTYELIYKYAPLYFEERGAGEL